jgi:hypothetical protein
MNVGSNLKDVGRKCKWIYRIGRAKMEIEERKRGEKSIK